MFQVCIIYAVVMYYNSRRRNAKLSRSALALPRCSPWVRLLMFGDDSSFLSMTGFSRLAFYALKDVVFTDVPVSRGRPMLLDKEGQLGLLLFYLGSRMQLKHLCMLFGIVPSSASVIINRMLILVPRKLRDNDTAAVRFPTAQEMPVLAAMVHAREPMAATVIGFLDGVAIPVQCSSDELEQGAFYNGYHHDTTINNTFLFLPTGKIGFACTNFPGSWHDTTVSAQLIRVVIECIGIYCICVDQGFPRSGELYGRFVGPISRRLRAQLAPALRDVVMQQHAVYVSLRQASEWGMRALQGTFSRLKSRLTSNKMKRGLLMQCVVLLHNFRTAHVGLNQIATVFNAHYEQYINLETYDRIARYFH
jgi:hypothetical protein